MSPTIITIDLVPNLFIIASSLVCHSLSQCDRRDARMFMPVDECARPTGRFSVKITHWRCWPNQEMPSSMRSPAIHPSIICTDPHWCLLREYLGVYLLHPQNRDDLHAEQNYTREHHALARAPIATP